MQDKPMMSMVKILVLGVFLSQGQASFFPGEKCSFLEYMSANVACMAEYSKELTRNVMTYIRENRGKRITAPHLLIAMFKNSCNSKALEPAIRCKELTDKMCQFSVIDSQVFRNAIKFICANTEGLTELGRCLDFYNDMGGISQCMKDLYYNPNDGTDPLCSYIRKFKHCLRPFMQKCPIYAMNTGYHFLDFFIIGKCRKGPSADTLNSGEVCSMIDHVIPSLTCVSPYTMRLFRRIYGSLNYVCDTHDIMATLTCLQHLDENCVKSLINVVEIKRVVKPICSNIKVFYEIPQCMGDYKDLLKCFLTQSLDEQSVCKYTERVHGCLLVFLHNCPVSLKKVITILYEAVIAKACSQQKAGPQCSAVEFVGHLGFCWTPMVVTVLQRIHSTGSRQFYRYNRSAVVREIEYYCKSETLVTSLRCHKEVDDLCQMSLIDAQKLQSSKETVCKNPNAMTKYPSCLNHMVNAVRKCENAMFASVRKFEELCSISERNSQCFLGYISPRCDQDIVEIINSTSQLAVPKYCSAATDKQPSMIRFVSLTMTFMITGYIMS